MKKFQLIFMSFIFSMSLFCGDSTITINEDIRLEKIGGGLYVHTTRFTFSGIRRFPSNGILLIKNHKALMVDTPNSNEQTEILYNYLKDSMKATVNKIIVGHSHSDCMGGLSFLHKMDVESIASERTKAICINRNLPVPKTTFSDSLSINFEGCHVICFYPGGGHTIDNIVVYFPESQVLFGGCLIRSLKTNNLGFTGEAVISEWDHTVKKIKNTFPDIKAVIPGHGEWGGTGLLNHTIQLVKDSRNKKTVSEEK